MTATRQLAFVLACLLCLLVVASALPAADLRLESPAGGDPGAGEWETIDGLPDTSMESNEETEQTPEDQEYDGIGEPDIEIEGSLEPGNEVDIETEYGSHFDDQTLEINGESEGELDTFGRGEATVPYTEEMTVSVPDEDASRTFDVDTNATIETHGGAAPGADLELSAVAGSSPLEAATVSVDGEAETETDEDGDATVSLPEAVEPAEIEVEREDISATQTVEIAEPDVRYRTPLLFPGSPAPIEVSADGTGVPNASVSVDGGEERTTDEDGTAIVWLPIDDEATVAATIGDERTTTTAENLYFRLGALAVVGPGFVIGAVWTYLRLIARYEGTAGSSGGFTRPFLSLATFLATLTRSIHGLVDGVMRTLATLSPRFRLPSFRFGSTRGGSMPTLGLSLPRFGGGLPSIGAGVATFGAALGSLSALGSLFGSASREKDTDGTVSSVGDWVGTDHERDTESDSAEDPSLVTTPLAPRKPRAEIRAAWHAFLDRLGMADRETVTPGQAARRALVDGYPADAVGRLVSIFRAVEYGSREPAPERVTEARETAKDLLEHDPEEDEP